MKDFVIRKEEAEDLEAIREVNRMAFGQDAEARLVDRLAGGPAFHLFEYARRSG